MSPSQPLAQKLIELNNEHKLCTFDEKKLMATEVAADTVDKEWKSYVVPVGVGMADNVVSHPWSTYLHSRVAGIPAPKGHSCHRPQRNGERKHKSVQTYTVDSSLSILNLVFVCGGIFLDCYYCTLLAWGPVSYQNLQALSLSKEVAVCHYVVRRTTRTEIQDQST